MGSLGPVADSPTPRSNDDVPKETIEEVASMSQEQIQESNNNEPMDVIEEEVVLEHQEQDVQEHNEDELEDMIEGIAPKYQALALAYVDVTYRLLRTLLYCLKKVIATFLLSVSQFHGKELNSRSGNNSNILGRGVFGRVYKGRLADGSLVAVKRQKERSLVCDLQFQTEMLMINMEVHRNLLRLRGFCKTPTERLLVYPWMSNGSVASWLYGRQPSEPPLDWNTRKRIAIGSARGLSCLHDNCDPKIIHRDVKPANIFLDENFEAVLGDFGHAKFIDYIGTHETTAVCGTYGYIAPEYYSSRRCSEKADVFSYGITLLELITGKRAYDPEHALLLLDWVTSSLKQKKVAENFGMFVDPDLSLNYNGDEVESLIQVALLCTDDSPLNRPGMSEVLRLIEGDGLAERWDDWQTGTEQQTVGSTNNHLEQIPDPMVHSDNHFEQIPDTFIYADNNHLRDVELSGPR